MLCPKCSNEISEGQKFCTSCGANLEELPAADPQAAVPAAEAAVTEAASAAVKAKNKKLPVIIAAAAAVVIAAVLLIIFLGKGGAGGKKAAGEYVKFSPDAVILYQDKVYCRTEGEVAELEDDGYALLGVSLDRSMALFYEYNEERLSVASKDGVQEIADSEVIACEMNLDGSVVVYAEKVSSSKVKIIKYNVKSGKSETLAETKDKDGNPVCVSPDGGSVLYVDDGELCFTVNGKVTETGEQGKPVAISDGGKYVYFIKEKSGKYYFSVIADGTTNKIAETTDLYGGASFMYFNRTLSEAAYYDYYSGTYCFSLNGAKGEKVKNFSFYPADFMPYYKETCANYYQANKTVFACSSFLDRAVCDGEEIRVLTADLKSEKIASKIQGGYVFNGGKSAVYVDSKGDLCYVKDVTRPDAEPEKLAEDIELYQYDCIGVTPDASLIYYLNDDGELHAVTFKGKDTVCEDDVHPRRFTMDMQTGTLYYIEDGSLYSVTGTESAEKIKLKKDASYFDEGYGLLKVIDVNDNYYLLLADGSFEKMG